MSRFKRRVAEPDAAAELSAAAAEQETLIPKEQPDKEVNSSSSRRTSPRAPTSEPPAEMVEASRPLRSSPRVESSVRVDQPSRDNSKRELAPPKGLSRNNSNVTPPDQDPRTSPRVQIVTPGNSRRGIPLLPLGAQGELPAGSEVPAPAPTGAAAVKELRQDVQGQHDRLQRLRMLHQSCGLGWLVGGLRWLRVGYDVEDPPRTKSFSDTHKGLDLRADASGLSLSVVVKALDTYKEHVTGLIRPVVRVHAVYLDSGLYVKSADRGPAPPVVTKAQLSHSSGCGASWEQELSLDAHFSDVVAENTLLLFEILDDKPSLSLDRSVRAKQSYYKKIAWAYLLPVGSRGQMNVGFGKPAPGSPAARSAQGGTARSRDGSGKDRDKDREPPSRPFHRPVRVQLHRYRRFDGFVGALQRRMLAWPALDPRYHSLDDPAHPNGIPAVYLQFRLLGRMPFEGAFLSLLLGPKAVKVRTPRLGGAGGSGGSLGLEDEEGDEEETDDALSPRSKAQQEEALALYERLARKKKRRLRAREDANKLRAAALRRVRRTDEPCAIPERFLRRLDVGPDGAMALAFSHCGHLLAIAARYDTQSAPLFNQDVVYSLILYDTDSDEEVWSEYIAHHGVVYDIKWSQNDRYLLTCAGDGTCKVWDLLYFCPLLEALDRARALAQAQATEGNTLFNAQGLTDEAPAPAPPSPAPAPAEVSKSSVLARHPPRVLQVLSLGTALYSYCGVFQEFAAANLLATMQLVGALQGPAAAGLLGLPTLHEQFAAIERSDVPRVIIGCADGRLRVFEDNRFVGFISVPSDDVAGGGGDHQDFSPHDAQVNSVVIDERSKYLITGDANGDVFAWRLDRAGWYQILRKFKRSAPPGAAANPLFNAQTAALEHFDSGSVLTMATHPVKARSLLLIHSRQPATLKVISLTTYKPVSFCEGYTGIPQAYLVREDASIFSAGVFFRAAFSADGRFIIACNTTSAASAMNARAAGGDGGAYRLLVWDTYTGHQLQTPLSALTFPYPVRALAWHPGQHLLAVTMVGEGAAVVLYCADSDNSFKLVDRKAEAAVQAANAANAASHSSLPAVDASMRASRDRLGLGSPAHTPSAGRPLSALSESREDFSYSLLDNSAFVRPKATVLDGTAQVLQGTRDQGRPQPLALSPSGPILSPAPAGASETLDHHDRMSRAKDMLERIRANRTK